MEISRKLFTAIICLTVLATSFGTATILKLPVHRSPRLKANVFILYETARGTWKGGSGNIITNIGERYARNVFGWDNVTAFNATQWISLGNATAGAALTKLTTEATTLGFTRAANDTCVAWNNGTDYAYNVTNQFTASGTIRVDATGLQWSGTSDSDNNLFAVADITATTFENNDNCTITWVITWDAN